MEENLYMDNILDHSKHPHNAGRIEGTPLHARELNPSCGDVIELFLQTDAHGKIEDVKFDGHGCAVSQASVSMLTDALKGKTVEEASKLSETDILAMLGINVGPMRMKCAMLSLRTLKSALNHKN